MAPVPALNASNPCTRLDKRSTGSAWSTPVRNAHRTARRAAGPATRAPALRGQSRGARSALRRERPNPGPGRRQLRVERRDTRAPRRRQGRANKSKLCSPRRHEQRRPGEQQESKYTEKEKSYFNKTKFTEYMRRNGGKSPEPWHRMRAWILSRTDRVRQRPSLPR